MFFFFFVFFFFKQKTAYEIMPSLVGSEMCIRDRSIVEDLVVPIIFSLVGESRCPDRASRQFGARHDGNRKGFTARAGSDRDNNAHLSTPQSSIGIRNPGRR